MNGFDKMNKKLLASQVEDALMDDILNKPVPIGEKIPNEYELAEMYGVGRSTIRETVKSLVSKGILEVRQGSGTYVIGTDTLENMTIRPASNLSTLVKVAQKGHLTVNNVKVKGENEAGTKCKISYAFYVDEGATLDIEGDDTEVGPFVGTLDAGAECVEVRKEATLNFRGGKLLGYSDADNNAYGRGIIAELLI